MRKKLKRFYKFFLYALLVLFLFAVISAVAIQTRPFKNWLKDTIVQTANKQLNGELQIERIDGNFFTHVKLSGIFLKVKQDTLLSLPELQVTYSLLALIGGEILVDSLLIDSPYLKLKQLPDTSWNIAALVKADSVQVKEDTLKSSQPFGWSIKLDDLQLKNAAIRINAADSLIPEKINNFNIRLAAFYSEARQELQLKEFRLSTKKPAFDLQEFSFHFQRDQQNVFLKDFTLRTRENALHGLGSYYTTGEKGSSGDLQSKPLQLEEFRVFLPDMQINVQPEFSFSYAYQDDSLIANLAIEDQDQQILFKLNAFNPLSLMETQKGKPFLYDINMRMLNLNLAHWAGDPQLNYLINGAIQVKGQGITPRNAELSYRADFDNCLILQNRIREIRLAGRYDRGDLQTAFKADGDFGLISFDADISNILDSAQYNLQMDADRLDLSAFIANDTFKTDLSVRAEISGSGFDPQKIKGSGQLHFAPSAIAGIEIDTLYGNLQFNGPLITIDTLHLNSNLARLNLSGRLNYAGESHLQLKTELGDLMAVKPFIAADTLHGNGALTLQINGKMDSLKAVADFSLDSLLFNQYGLETLSGSGSVLSLADKISGEGNVHAVNLGSDAIKLDSIGLQANFSNQNVSVILDISRRDFNAHLKGRYSQDTTSQLLLSELVLNIKDQTWKSGQQAQITFDSSMYKVENLQLTSDAPGGTQSISAGGVIRTQGKEDFSLSIKGLDIGVVKAMTELPVEMEGIFSMDISLKGFADEPVIEGSMKVDKGRINQFESKSFNGEFEYRKHKLSWLFKLNAGQMKPLVLDGYIPLHFSLKEQQEMFSGNTPLNVNLHTEQFPMTFLEAANISDLKTKGYIACDLKVTGIFDKPRPSGFFRIENSGIEIPEFGINYKDLQLELLADSAEVALKKFRINQKDGFLKANGKIQFDSSLISGKLSSMEFGLSAKEFFLVRHSDYQLQLSGNTFLKGNTQEPQFGGNIEILRSSFFLPALTGENKSSQFKDEQGTPLLVKEKRKMQSRQDTLSQNRPVAKDDRQAEPPDIYKKLRGSLNITIPKNTWIKSPDMRLELGGDFNAVKNGPDMEVFGTIRIIRGYYELLGRRFTIKEGELIFQGGKEINPRVILEAEYVFRTPAREKRSLILNVSGEAKTPQLEFFLEEQKINEGDAIAYIMFGRSMDELTAGQQEGMAAAGGGSSTEDLALGLAANLISAELTKLVGQKLNLDYIEIKSQDDWQSSSFVVGKYLTNDLFVSYQREFGDSQDDSVPKQVVTLEYELTEFLFLELLGNSKYNGFDVIFKFDRE